MKVHRAFIKLFYLLHWNSPFGAESFPGWAWGQWSWYLMKHRSHLEKAMATHSSTLSWKIPWTEEPSRLQSMGSQKSRTQLRDFTFPFHFHALEKEMATHFSVLAWIIPGTAEPGGLPSLGSRRVGYDWSDLAAAGHIYKDSVFRW